MNRFLTVAFVSLVLMFSCKGNKTAGIADTPADSTDSVTADTAEVDSMELLITDTPMPKAADELFDDFIFNFSANSKLQMERIAFPLSVTRNGKTEQIARSAWKTERFFMHQGYYTVFFNSEKEMALVNDTSVNHAIVEKVYFNTGAVQQYMFRRIKGAWMLIEMKTEPIAANLDASFLEFYHKFVTDSVFQASSLHETVQFVGPDPDDDFAQMEGVITADTWPAFAPELPEKMIYNIYYGEPKRPGDLKIFVMRGIANGLELEMTFKHTDGKWVLTKLTT